jgi:hypothetical protein
MVTLLSAVAGVFEIKRAMQFDLDQADMGECALN